VVQYVQYVLVVPFLFFRFDSVNPKTPDQTIDVESRKLLPFLLKEHLEPTLRELRSTKVQLHSTILTGQAFSGFLTIERPRSHVGKIGAAAWQE